MHVPDRSSMRVDEVRKRLHLCNERWSRNILATSETRGSSITRATSATFSERRQGE